MRQGCTHSTRLPQASEGCPTLAHWLSRALAHKRQVRLQREAEGKIEQ